MLAKRAHGLLQPASTHWHPLPLQVGFASVYLSFQSSLLHLTLQLPEFTVELESESPKDLEGLGLFGILVLPTGRNNEHFLSGGIPNIAISFQSVMKTQLEKRRVSCRMEGLKRHADVVLRAMV